MKRASSLLVLCGMLALANASFGASFASDSASNSTYSGGAYAGLNGGSGFLAWTVYGNAGTNGGYGSYVGQTGVSGTVNAFGLYSYPIDSGSYANAVRPFNGALTAGQTFSVDLGHTTIGTDGTVGLSLQNSASTTEINLVADGTNWMLSAGSAAVNIATDAANTDFRFTLTYNGGSSYSYTFTGSTGGTNLTATNTISGITQANFFDFQQGNNFNLGFTNLSIVPEPGAWAMLLMGGFGTLAVARYRNRLAR